MKCTCCSFHWDFFVGSPLGGASSRTIRKVVLTLLNMGTRDPTLLLVRCGVCGKAASTIVDIDTPKWVVQLEARSPRHLAKPPCRTCFLRPRLSPHTPGGSPLHAIATSQQLQRPPCSSPSRALGRSVVGQGTHLPASSLAAATPAGISTPPHHQRARLGLTHVIW